MKATNLNKTEKELLTEVRNSVERMERMLINMNMERKRAIDGRVNHLELYDESDCSWLYDEFDEYVAR